MHLKNKTETKPHPANKVQFIVLQVEVLSAFQHATQIKKLFYKRDNPLFSFFFWHLCLFGGNKTEDISDKRGKRTQKKHQTSTTLLSGRHRTLNKRWGKKNIFFVFCNVCWVPLRSGLWPKPVLSGWATTKMFFGHTMAGLHSDHITARAQTEWLQ